MSPIIKWLWSLYAKSYDGLLFFWPYQNLLSLMNGRIKPQPMQAVLDLGCGTGNLLAMAISAQPDAHYTGLDVSPGMLAVARKKLRASVDAGRLELVEDELMSFLVAAPDDSYDLIASMNVLYTVADQTALWHELMRVLKPHGQIIVTTSVRPGSGPIIREHFQHAGVLTLLRPRLLAVFIIDALINILGHTGHFAFADQATLNAAIAASGGHMTDVAVCYGGPTDGVNILFTTTK